MSGLANKKQRLELELERLALLKEDVARSIAQQEDIVRRARTIYRKACPHENIREEDDFDYHNNTDWTAKYCKDCGEYLGRY